MHDSKAPQPRKRGVPFGMVDVAVMRDPSLTVHVKIVYACLATHADRLGVAYPSKALLAREAGLSVRTVDAAIKSAEAAGLLSVKRSKRDGSAQNQVNRYTLHDLGRGYVPQALPGTAGDAGGGTAGDAVPTAGGAQEPDHRTRPSPNQTISTSGDAACVPHADARGGEIAPRTPKLYLPSDYADMPEKAVCRWLVGAAVKAIEHAGYQVAPDAAQRMGRALRAKRGDGVDRDRLAVMLADVIADPAAHGLTANGEMSPTPSEASPVAQLDPDSLDYCDDVAALVEDAAGSLGADTVALIYGMAAEGRHPNAVYNAAVANEQRGGAWAS